MKNILIITFLLNLIYANDDINTTSLDMFLFKIGFKAMARELDEQKELTKTNIKRIQKLEEKIQSLLDINQKAKIKNTFLIKQTNKIKISKFNNFAKYKIAVVALNNTKIHNKNKVLSKIIKIVNKNDIVKISYCGKYQWCKLYNEDGYIAKYKIKF